jgi:transposase InsO family protein
VKFEFIKMHTEHYPVNLLCKRLAVSRSGYYAYLKRKPSKRQQANDELLSFIRAIHEQSGQVYGSPRIHAELFNQKMPCSLGRVKRLMRQEGIYAKLGRKYKHKKAKREIAYTENLIIKEQTQITSINQVWYADITQVKTSEGWFYLAAIMDAYSRRIVGYAMADNMKTNLIIQALSMAIKQRRPANGLMHHSDQGSQYTSYAFERELKSQGIRASFTSTGACLDNAYIESFFASLKKEKVYKTTFNTREEARAAIFEYINITYNRFRLHSSLSYKSPETFEALQSQSSLEKLAA